MFFRVLGRELVFVYLVFGRGIREEIVFLVFGIIGWFFLCCRNVFFVRSGGKELLVVVCSVFTVVV